MIQDIAPAAFYNEYIPEKPRLHDMCFMFENDSVFVNKTGGSIEFPTYGMLSARMTSYRYLFCIDDTNYYMVTCNDINRYGFKYVNVRELRYSEPKLSVFALMTAYHLYSWYRNNKYCGRCAKELVHDENLRALDCECGNQVFPRISPAVIVAVLNEDKLLLTKYKGRAYKNYALVAGFAEIGETIEETVKREVMEETGLNVTRVHYYASQPWGVDSNLLMGFFARLEGSAEIRVDDEELSEAGWFRRSEIEMNSDGISLTSQMIEAFKNGHQG